MAKLLRGPTSGNLFKFIRSCSLFFVLLNPARGFSILPWWRKGGLIASIQDATSRGFQASIQDKKAP